MSAERWVDLRRSSRSGRRSVVRDSLLRLFRRAAGPLIERKDAGRRTEIRKTLIIRPDHLGDVLFTTPALELWRRGRPAGVETTLSLGAWNQSLIRHLPPLEHVESYSYPGFTRTAKGSFLAPYVALMREARRLRREKYDLAVILRFDHWWGGLLAYVAGIPMRLGYATSPLADFLNESLPYEG